MSLPLILLLFVVSAVLARVRLRSSARVLFALAVILTLAVGCGLTDGLMLRALQTGYPDEPLQPWKPKAAIIVLGGGTQHVDDTGGWQVPVLVYGRIVKGLELYLQCKRSGGSCVMVVSGGDPLNLGVTEAKVYSELLAKLGVEPADLVMEANSHNTWQNAQFCAAWLKEHPQDQVRLVTSGIHVQRSLLYFSHFGVQADGVRADYESAHIGLLPTAHHFLGTDIALHEYAGMARYYLYEFLGWNIEAQRPGAL